jgi:hypothetical protein
MNETDLVDYEQVIAALSGRIGKRVTVSIDCAEPNLSVARFEGRLSGAHPQSSREAGGIEEGVMSTIETTRGVSEITFFDIWRHETGRGTIDELGVGWRVGVVATIVNDLEP